MLAAAETATPQDPAELIRQSREHFDSRRYAHADTLAGQAVDLLEGQAQPDTLLLATAHVSLSRARAGQRLLADSVATRSARRCLQLLNPANPDHTAPRAEAHDVLAVLLEEQNRVDLALDHARRALALRRARFGEINEEVGESYYRLGNMHLDLGANDSALVNYRQGLIVRRQCNIERDRRIGDLHSEIATVLERKGDLDGARQELDQMLHEYESRLGPTHTAMCAGLQRMAIFHYNGGEIAQAVDLVQRAVAIGEAAEGYSPANVALMRANLAVTLSALGDASRARKYISLALPVYEEFLGPTHRQVLWAQGILADTEFALGDTASAAARYRAVCAHYASNPQLSNTGSLTAAKTTLARVAEPIDPRDALRLYVEGEAAERLRPDRRWSTIINLRAQQLRLHASLGEFEQVDALIAQIQTEVNEQGVRGNPSETDFLSERGLAMLRAGRPDEALRWSLAAARQERELLLRNLRALDDREALTLSAKRSRPLAALLAQAATANPSQRQEIWEELIRWRGRIASELALRRLPAGSDIDEATRSAHAEWLAARRRLAQWQVRVQDARDAESLARLEELQLAADTAGRRWSAVAPRAAQDSGELEFDDVVAALPKRSVLIGLATIDLEESPARLIAFARQAGQRDVQYAELGDAFALQEALERWRALASQSPRNESAAEARCRSAGEELRRLSWDRLVPLIGDARAVYLVGEGALAAVPWYALPDGERDYLVDRDLRIHTLLAERDLLSDAPAGNSLLAVGEVDFGSGRADESSALQLASTRAVLADCDSSIPRDFEALPGTAAELDAIATLWKGGLQQLRGAAASEASFKHRAAGRRVLHLATHSLALTDSCTQGEAGTRGVGGRSVLASEGKQRPHRESPWLGRRVLLAFAGANHAHEYERDENEGLLTAEEVVTLDLGATEWVVLSACESGVAQTWNREGLLGMSRAFRLAGARVVIASQWAVDDEHTRAWMTALYQARRDGATSAAEAVRAACRSVLAERRAAGLDSHPFYWGAFLAAGA